MLFPTTIAGSLPKPSWLAETERLWPQWRQSGDALAEAMRDATRIALFEQEHAGIDVVTDGEQSRQHFVHGFVAGVEGIDFEKKVRRGIRADRYEAECPSVVAPVRRRKSVHAQEVRFARGVTDRTLKITIPGPMTIVDTLYDGHYGSRRDLAFAFAEVIRDEILDLCTLGVDVVQLDEPAFNVYFEEVDAWGIDALDAAIAGVSCRTAVHVCYGYGIQANLDWKHSLGEHWDQYDIVLPMLERSNVDQVAIELAGSRVPPRVLAHLKTKNVAVGCIDVASDEIEKPSDVIDTIERALEYLPAESISPTTNCGMAPMSRAVAYAKLRALGDGAKLMRERYAGQPGVLH
ncbi:MAG TPA: methionine synthase [Candidatus Acidoferrales bacterium]|nr:methionine synthase [Candidatus Acidoferrales bacterium]